jgi:hypothetical protein
METLPIEVENYYANSKPLFLYNGLFQIRSPATEPIWNNIFRYWVGDMAFYKSYQSIRPSDVIFAQDGFGDQYFLRDNIVWLLRCESDDSESLNMSFETWLNWIDSDPGKNLNMDLDLSLKPGYLFFAFPPFCVADSEPASIKEIEVDQVIGVHAGFASQIRNTKDGEPIQFKVV